MNKLKTIILLCVGTISGCAEFIMGTPGVALYINKCDSSIEAHHNDGGIEAHHNDGVDERAFMIAPGEAEGFRGGGGHHYIPTYIIEGKTNEFHIKSLGNGGYWYTACHNEKNLK